MGMGDAVDKNDDENLLDMDVMEGNDKSMMINKNRNARSRKKS
jgi:hypothetical protein